VWICLTSTVKVDTMNKKQLSAFGREAGKGIKTEAEMATLTRQLRESFYEAALNAELDEHLGYERHGHSPSDNRRNGSTRKTLIADEGRLEIQSPRDRQGDFAPQIIKKRQARTPSMDSKILSFYAKGMSTREVVATLEELYDTDVSPTLVSRVTNSVLEQVTEWQSRPLDDIYPIVYLDCIVLKIRQDHRVINKAVYLALGVNLEGHKELLGLWLSEHEGAKFWLGVMTELQNRALEQFGDRWDEKYPQISRSWRTHWDNLNTLFHYPADIRKAIYTTNAIESVNSVIR